MAWRSGAGAPAAGQPGTEWIGEDNTLVKLQTSLGNGRQDSLFSVENTVGVAPGGDPTSPPDTQFSRGKPLISERVMRPRCPSTGNRHRAHPVQRSQPPARSAEFNGTEVSAMALSPSCIPRWAITSTTSAPVASAASVAVQAAAAQPTWEVRACHRAHRPDGLAGRQQCHVPLVAQVDRWVERTAGPVGTGTGPCRITKLTGKSRARSTVTTTTGGGRAKASGIDVT